MFDRMRSQWESLPFFPSESLWGHLLSQWTITNVQSGACVRQPQWIMHLMMFAPENETDMVALLFKPRGQITMHACTTCRTTHSDNNKVNKVFNVTAGLWIIQLNVFRQQQCHSWKHTWMKGKIMANIKISWKNIQDAQTMWVCLISWQLVYIMISDQNILSLCWITKNTYNDSKVGLFLSVLFNRGTRKYTKNTA